jgi:phosphohistidine phosphatase
MRQLLLLRHAKSAWDDPDLPDHARPLNARGRAAAAAMSGAMHGLGLEPDLVLVSTARRTMQTLAALEPWPELPLIEPMDALYLASAERILTVLRGVAETVRSVLVIGHNPGLHQAAMALAGDAVLKRGAPMARRLAEAYPTGALAEFAVASPWWSMGTQPLPLIRFLAPRDLPDPPPGDLSLRAG